MKLPIDVITKKNLDKEIFANCIAKNRFEVLKNRALIAPLNEDVNKLRTNNLGKLPRNCKFYYSLSFVKVQQKRALKFTPDCLNSVELLKK